MDYFGGRNVSGIIGVLYTSAGIGTLIGPSAAGFAFDISHSYTVPILISAAGNVIAALIMAATSESAPSKTSGQSAGRVIRSSLVVRLGNPSRAIRPRKSPCSADLVDAAFSLTAPAGISRSSGSRNAGCNRR